MWNFYLNYTNELVYKTETESQKTDIENKLTTTERETEWRDKAGSSMDTDTPLCMKQTKQRLTLRRGEQHSSGRNNLQKKRDLGKAARIRVCSATLSHRGANGAL